METRQQRNRWDKVRIYPESHYKNLWEVSNLAKIFTEIAKNHPDAKFEKFYEIVEDQRSFMSMEIDPIMETSYYVKFTYMSPETDKEFEDRMVEQERKRKEIEERDKLEYLRLKAKYEN